MTTSLSEMALASLLNQLEEADRKRSKAVQELARAAYEMARQDAWRRVDEALTECRLLQEKVVEAWRAVKEERSAKGVAHV